MPRRVFYGVGFWSFLAAIGMTLAANIIPEWLVFTPDLPTAQTPHHTYGLHSRCTNLGDTTTCHPFPRTSDCRAPSTSKHFCTYWRSTSFLLSFAVALQLATVVVFTICVGGGKQKRSQGWKVLVVLLGISIVAKVAAAGIMANMRENEERFADGWEMGRSWVLCLAAGGVELAVAAGLAGAKWWCEEEGGYELIPEVPRNRRRG